MVKEQVLIQGATNVRHERRFRTFRLRPDDKKAIQSLGKGTGRTLNRHDALLELASEISELEVSIVTTEQRVPMRIGIPTEIDQAIRELKLKTKQSYVSILLAAVHRKLQQERKPRRDRPPRSS